MRSPGVGSDHLQPAASMPVLDAGPICVVLEAPLVGFRFESRFQEVENVAESDNALVEAAGNQNRLGHRFDQWPVESSGSNRSRESGLAVAPRDRQASIPLDTECPPDEPCFPRVQVEQLARVPALSDCQALDVCDQPVSYRVFAHYLPLPKHTKNDPQSVL